MAADGIRVSCIGAVLVRVLGPADERWDEIAIVGYPSFAAFRRATESLEYKAEAAHHRTATLEDSRLIATARMF